MRKVIKATTRANHLTSLPLPLSGKKGTTKALTIGKRMDKDNHGKLVKPTPNFPNVPREQKWIIELTIKA